MTGLVADAAVLGFVAYELGGLVALGLVLLIGWGLAR